VKHWKGVQKAVAVEFGKYDKKGCLSSTSWI